MGCRPPPATQLSLSFRALPLPIHLLLWRSHLPFPWRWRPCLRSPRRRRRTSWLDRVTQKAAPPPEVWRTTLTWAERGSRHRRARLSALQLAPATGRRLRTLSQVWWQAKQQAARRRAGWRRRGLCELSCWFGVASLLWCRRRCSCGRKELLLTDAWLFLTFCSWVPSSSFSFLPNPSSCFLPPCSLPLLGLLLLGSALVSLPSLDTPPSFMGSFLFLGCRARFLTLFILPTKAIAANPT